MSLFDSRYYNLDRKLLAAIGLWPYEDESKLRQRKVLVLSVMGSAVLTGVAGMVSVEWTMSVIAEVAPLLITFFTIMCKFFATWYKMKKIRALCEYMEVSWSSLQNEEELKIAKESAEFGRRYNMYFASVLYSFAVGMIFSPFSVVLLDIILPLNESRQLPVLYISEYCIDRQKYYFPILLHQYLAVLVSVTILVGTDIVYISELQHACGLFHLAGYRFKYAFDMYTEKNICYGKVVALSRKMIADGVECHRQAIWLVSEISDCYKEPHTLLAIIGAVSISISVFSVIACAGLWKQMILSACFSGGQIFYGFLLMYPAQHATDESARIFHDIYNSKWYATPTVLQKLAVIVMRKSLTPVVMVLGKLIPLSMMSYSAIIQAALSYFMMLYSLR